MTIGTFTLFAVTGTLVVIKLVLMALAAVLLTHIIFFGKKKFALRSSPARLKPPDRQH
jgi:hypothetical protein